MRDDDEATADEQREAEALARALAAGPEGDRPPPEALEAAALLGFARSGGALDAGRAPAIRDLARAAALSALRPLRRRLVWAWVTAPLVAGAAALLVLATRPPPRLAGGWPAPPAAVLQAQAAAARGEPGAIGRLDDSMKRYRQNLLAGMRAGGGGR